MEKLNRFCGCGLFPIDATIVIKEMTGRFCRWPAGGIFEAYGEDRQARTTPAALAGATPQQRTCE